MKIVLAISMVGFISQAQVCERFYIGKLVSETRVQEIELQLNDSNYEHSVSLYNTFVKDLKATLKDDAETLSAVDLKQIEQIEFKIAKKFPDSNFSLSSKFGITADRLASQLKDIYLNSTPQGRDKNVKFLTFMLNGQNHDLEIKKDSLTRQIRTLLLSSESSIPALTKQFEELAAAHLTSLKFPDAISIIHENTRQLLDRAHGIIERHESSWKNMSTEARRQLTELYLKSGLIASDFHVEALKISIDELFNSSTNKTGFFQAGLNKTISDFSELQAYLATQEGQRLSSEEILKVVLTNPNFMNVRNLIAEKTMLNFYTAADFFPQNGTDRLQYRKYSPVNLAFAYLQPGQKDLIRKILSYKDETLATRKQKESYFREVVENSIESTMLAAIQKAGAKKSDLPQLGARRTEQILTAVGVLGAGSLTYFLTGGDPLAALVTGALSGFGFYLVETKEGNRFETQWNQLTSRVYSYLTRPAASYKKRLADIRIDATKTQEKNPDSVPKNYSEVKSLISKLNMELKQLQNAVNTNEENMTSMMREAEFLYSEIPKNEQQTDNNNKLRKGISELLNLAAQTNKAMAFSLESFDPFLEQVEAARVFLLNVKSENSAVTKRTPKDINQFNKDLISLGNFLNSFNALILRNEITRQKIDVLRNTLI